MKAIYLIILLMLSVCNHASDLKPWSKALQKLTPAEREVIINKGTEKPFSGKYVNSDEKGVYRCKVCNAPLYNSDDKFETNCGWPSFDDAIPGAIKRKKDTDGRRTEILCARCGAHLGHVFEGEGLTPKNIRHCVNSVSLTFDKGETIKESEYKRAYFAGGCFWGVEYYLEKLDGVKEVTSGFMGGKVEYPTYYQVVRTKTGHLETVEIVYDPQKTSYEKLARTFFEIHDPTQQDGQGPDIGEQYRSAIFVADDEERATIEKLITLLGKKGYKIVTKILPKSPFYKAEEYHQDYYDRHGKKPYCHAYMKRF
ncbi:MAG: bifunctional methionine sulfoxide reductase B/A protein [Campylobacterota bacterium]|nr:bifunctional methionine sulfoxide reductase B/A protein [Campylobacterota bacterium]